MEPLRSRRGPRSTPDRRVEAEKATKAAPAGGWSGKVIQGLAASIPNLVGGSADLAGSNKTDIESAADFFPETPDGRNVRYGVREHSMGAVMNGMALHGGIRPFGGTFLIFSDYMRPAIRLAALMDSVRFAPEYTARAPHEAAESCAHRSKD